MNRYRWGDPRVWGIAGARVLHTRGTVVATNLDSRPEGRRLMRVAVLNGYALVSAGKAPH